MSLIGRAKDVYAIPNLPCIISKEGFQNVKLLYLGGMWVLFEFDSLPSKEKFLNHSSIGSWFTELIQVTNSFENDERIVWISIKGLPIKAWTPNTFCKIASLWGEYVEWEDADLKSLSCKHLCLKTNMKVIINERQKVIIQGKVYWIRIKELDAWFLNFQEDEQDDLSSDGESQEGDVANKADNNESDVDRVSKSSFMHENDTAHKDVNRSSAGCSGAILCMWNPNMFVKEQVSTCDYFVALMGTWAPTSSKLLIISVYAPQELNERRDLWDYLRTFIDRWEGDTVIMGDFKEVRSKHERFGSTFNRQGAIAFNNFISLACLINLPLEGYAFTWAYKSASKMSKLDRYLISEDQFQEDPPEVPMADNRTMTQLLQAPTVGYEDAIVIPEILATNFKLKHGLINLVQNKQFFGHDKEDPHAHIRYFNKITSTMRVPNIPNSTIKLMLFPFSLEGAARIWLEKEPSRSILTWDDLVSKFVNQFFPPSKTTNLRNEITRFQQRFDESFSKAWDRFNDLLRACPHHGFSELHQVDTLYNALNAVVAKVNSISSTLAISSDVAELKDMVRALLLDKKNQSSARATSPTPAPVKAVESNCVTCGVLRNIQSQGQSTQNQCQNIQNQYQTVQNRLANLTDMMSKFMSSNMASSLGSGTLPGNTVTNPKEDLKGITTRSGVTYQGPTFPTPSKVVKQGIEVTKDQVQTPCSQSTAHVRLSVTQSETPVSEPIAASVSASMPNLKPSIPYPSRHDNERRHEQANEQIEKFYEIFKDMSFEISFTDALILMPKFATTLKALIGNKEKLSEMA
nr:RNA-directed DNA polymerase, eukaryota [Tanacetum cinerariifolium]